LNIIVILQIWLLNAADRTRTIARWKDGDDADTW
jgi:hypothetical protein